MSKAFDAQWTTLEHDESSDLFVVPTADPDTVAGARRLLATHFG